MTMPPTHAPSRWMLVLGSAPRANDAGVLVPQKSPDVSYVSRHMRKRTAPPMVLLPTHTPPPPLWNLVLRVPPRASGAGNLVPHTPPERPPEFCYISRRVRHDHRLPSTSEDVNVVSVYCFTWVRKRCSATLTDAYATIYTFRTRVRRCTLNRWTRLGTDGVVQLQRDCASARGGAKERVAVAAAVAALLAGAPDSGDAQAGGVSLPFTVCARSWFEVWGSVWESEGGGGRGGERGLSDRCGVLDVALRAWALSCRGLGAGAGCGLLL